MALTQIKTSGIADDAVTLAKQAGGTDGQIITYDASGNPSAVGPGSDGQVLTSTGAGSPPAFETPAAGGISDIVSDTSPQLGGDLDTNSFEIGLDDSHKVKFGDGNDLQIYHDGSDSWVNHTTGSGSLVIKCDSTGSAGIHLDSDYIKFRNEAQNETLLQATNGGAVDLYHNDSKKLETTSTGATVTGGLVVHIDSATGEPSINFTNSDTGTGTSNGFGIGINDAELPYIWNRENTDIRIATNATERMRIHNDGHVSQLGMPFGTIHYSTDGSASSNSEEDLVEQASHTDTNGMNIGATNRMTVPYDGIYLFTCSIGIEKTADTDRPRLSLKKNGADEIRQESQAGKMSGSWNTFTITVAIDMSANDYLDLDAVGRCDSGHYATSSIVLLHGN